MAIVNPQEYQLKLQAIAKHGLSKIHILSDFDRTITKGIEFQNTSVIAKLRESKHIDDEMKRKLGKIYAYYHPFEIDPDLSNAEKSKYMVEWYKKTNQVFVDHKLSKPTLRKVVAESDLDFREQTYELFALCAQHEIPIIIISAGLGDLIQMYLEKHNLLSEHVHIVSNFFKFNQQDQVCGMIGSTIHPMNKYESIIEKMPFYKDIKNRTSVIQMGDHIGDYHMVSGFLYKELVSISFLSQDCPKLLEQFQAKFDVVYTHEADMSEAIKIIQLAQEHAN